MLVNGSSTHKIKSRKILQIIMEKQYKNLNYSQSGKKSHEKLQNSDVFQRHLRNQHLYYIFGIESLSLKINTTIRT